MSLLHHAFLFDYEAFKRRIAPLLHALDQGNYELLYQQAEAIVATTRPETWILHDRGTMLESIDPSRGVDAGDIGYWILIILSTFLQPAPSLGTNWVILLEALTRIGWSEDDAWLLIRGMPTASLLKPEIDVTPGTPLRGDEPYWYWVIPTQSYQRGWLSLEQIHHLRDRLTCAQSVIRKTTVGALWYGVNAYQMGKSVSLDIVYNDALTMLQVAEGARCGLFMVIS